MQYIQEKYLSATCFKNTVKRISAAGMAAYNICRSANLVQCAFYHLMGYGICKKYQKVWTSYLFTEVGLHLCKYFTFTFIRFADFFVLSYHSVMSAYDYDTHNFVLLVILSYLYVGFFITIYCINSCICYNLGSDSYLYDMSVWIVIYL